MTVGCSFTLLSLYCVVPTGAEGGFGAGGASRTGKATPCEGCGRPERHEERRESRAAFFSSSKRSESIQASRVRWSGRVARTAASLNSALQDRLLQAAYWAGLNHVMCLAVPLHLHAHVPDGRHLRRGTLLLPAVPLPKAAARDA